MTVSRAAGYTIRYLGTFEEYAEARALEAS